MSEDRDGDPQYFSCPQDQETIRRYVARSRAEQDLGPTVTDPGAIARVLGPLGLRHTP